MGIGNSSLVWDSPQRHVDAGHQDVATSTTRPEAWADLDHKLRTGSIARTKERIQCICEGGHQCESEDPRCQMAESPFPGLHSSWVTTQVLAMARPWQENLVTHKLPETMQAAGVGMILNLQEVGEHAHCGRGILPGSGFSYDPEAFMAADIGVYNFSWRDMGVPTLFKMMDIVQVMVHVTQEQQRKIAVHCHAGLGRTGLAIACYLVFLGECDAQDAVRRVRQGRPGALQTQQQEHFVQVFQVYLVHLRCVFRPSNAATTHTPTSWASAQSQPADLHSGSSTPSTASRPSHRLQVQSTPSTAQESPHGREEMQDVDLAELSTAGPDVVGPDAVGADAVGPHAVATDAAEPDAAGPHAAGPHVVGSGAVGPDAAGPDAAGSGAAGPDAARLGTNNMAGSSAEESCSLTDTHLMADDESMGGYCTTNTGHASRLASAKPRLRGLRLPWLTNQAGHSPEQVNGRDSAGGTSYRTETLWSQEGAIRAGSRQNMRKGQVYRASPPADLGEALDRQRHLLHGQDLRNYWNLPKVAGVIAAALEKHVAHAVPSQTGTLGVGMQAASGISEATAAQQADHTASAAAAIGDVSVIAMEVNAGNWEGLEAASPSVLMQLLQRWFQSFDQPMLSVPQQTAMLAALDTHNGNTAASDSALQQQEADVASQDTGMNQAVVGDAMLRHDLPRAASQCSTKACAAAIVCLSTMQRVLIHRIVKCIVAITAEGLGGSGSSRPVLMQWLATALTSPYQLGMNRIPSVEQQALVRALDQYASSSGTVQAPNATILQPALKGVVETAVVTENMTTSAGAQTARCDLDACVKAETSILTATDTGVSDKIAAHLPESDTTAVAAEGESRAVSKQGREVEHSVEEGCMWFHKRIGKVGLSKFL